jgi:hypothetical protein
VLEKREVVTTARSPAILIARQIVPSDRGASVLFMSNGGSPHLSAISRQTLAISVRTSNTTPAD